MLNIMQHALPACMPCPHGSRVPVQCQYSTSHNRRSTYTHRREHGQQRGARLVTRMGIRAIESFDATFEISDEARSMLTELLSSDAFCHQVARETAQAEGTELKFADMLFQPVPWSVQTKKGMPAEFEQYLEDPKYAIINVPPNFMFKAKIFKPSRLCAIYQAV